MAGIVTFPLKLSTGSVILCDGTSFEVSDDYPITVNFPQGTIFKSSQSSNEEFKIVDKKTFKPVSGHGGYYDVELLSGTKLKMKKPNCDVVLKENSTFLLTADTSVDVPSGTTFMVSDIRLTKDFDSTMFLYSGRYAYSGAVLQIVRNETPNSPTPTAK